MIYYGGYETLIISIIDILLCQCLIKLFEVVSKEMF